MPIITNAAAAPVTTYAAAAAAAAQPAATSPPALAEGNYKFKKPHFISKYGKRKNLKTIALGKR